MDFILQEERDFVSFLQSVKNDKNPTYIDVYKPGIVYKSRVYFNADDTHDIFLFKNINPEGEADWRVCNSTALGDNPLLKMGTKKDVFYKLLEIGEATNVPFLNFKQ